MRLSGLQILFSLAATALGASDVADLTASNFDDYINKHDIVLAEFFAPWCGHCKNLAPEYEQAATELKERTEDLALAKVDCTENQELCTDHGVQGFPTLYVFENGKKTGQYQGPRKAADIKSFLIKRSLPVVYDAKNAKGVKDWLAKNHEDNPLVYVYTGPADGYEAFAEIAKTLRERASFLRADDAALKKEYDGANIVVLRNGENKGEPVHSYGADEPLTVEAITKFVRSNEFPAFGEVGPDTYQAYIENGSPMLYAFVTSDEERQLVKEALTPHLPSLKGKANVVFLNASIYGMHAENVNLRKEFPAMVVHRLEDNKKFLHDQDTPLSIGSIGTFVKDYLANKILPHIKSEPVPESQDEPVYTLVGSEYEAVVLDNDKDVLVEYYAPWCGHCKNLKPVFDELAEQFEDLENIVIAKLDHTANEVPDKIAGYPTIKFYPAGKKDEPITYEGSRSLDDLVEFVKKHSTSETKEAAKKPAAAAQKKKAAAGSEKELKDEL